jgi:iron-sulfur cluster repair protein YtfE (RIC family)
MEELQKSLLRLTSYLEKLVDEAEKLHQWRKSNNLDEVINKLIDAYHRDLQNKIDECVKILSPIRL